MYNHVDSGFHKVPFEVLRLFGQLMLELTQYLFIYSLITVYYFQY